MVVEPDLRRAVKAMASKGLILAALIAMAVLAGYVMWYELGSTSGGAAPQGLTFGQATSSGTGPWTVETQGVNSASSPITVTEVTIGGVDFTGQVAPPGLPLTVQPDASFLLSITVSGRGGESFSAGQSLTIDILTSSGMSYQVEATLPSAGSTGSAAPVGGGGNEMLVLTASVINGVLNVTALNQSPGPVTIRQVYFNGVPAAVTFGSGFSQTVAGQLMSAATGTFVVETSGTVSGTLYNVVVITAEGNSFQAAVLWP